MYRYIIYLLFICFISSCSKQFIRSGSTVYTINNLRAEKQDGLPDRDQRDIKLHRNSDKYKLTEKDKLQVKDDHVLIKVENLKTPGSFLSMDVEKNVKGISDFRRFQMDETKGLAYFPNKGDTTEAVLKIRTGNKLFKGGWKFSAVTISAKNRDRISKSARDHRNTENLDDIEDTWETKFSPGIAFTNEFVKWTTYSKDMSSNSVSMSVGPVFSLGTQEISEKTTMGRSDISRKALSLTLGGVLGIDINKFDVGFYGGLEWATGKDSKDWVYQGVPHFGFLIGYELVKPK